MLKKTAIVLVNYKDYAKKYLADCQAGLDAQDYAGELKEFIVDNESSSESLAAVKKISPQAEIIINLNNDGFAKGNNDAIREAMKQGYEHIILFNLDAVMLKDCVRKMVEAADSGDSRVGAVQARLMLFDRKEIINSLGNVTHFLGFGYTGGYGDRYNSPDPYYQGGNYEICYPSGAAVLFKAEILKKIGLFDEEFWMYNEDQDLGWRIWLAGATCVLAPEAVAYHKYEFSRSIKKYYYLDRNRIMAIIKNYHWATLAVILPAFLAMEIGLIFFSLKNGWFYEKIKVYNYFFTLKNWQHLSRARRETQSLRKAKDREIVKLFSGKIWYQEIGEARLRVANVFFNAYWKFIRSLLWW